MSSRTSSTKVRRKSQIGAKVQSGELMENKVLRTSSAKRLYVEHKRPQVNSQRPFPSSYFTVESFVILGCLTASLLVLPLLLPPLPPPPFLLLLLPIGILVVLLILAFMPSDTQNIASPYL